ncbi:PstS family phosphate ABC transporter substrate-binding protein [Leptolyngbya sp. AN02str]|uniref:PstS family phosphate ABC transporter substrate-binding protein n=1 Tax=Leptolyngbya sp. AN02str TaxID=3423363 RepID=UPI003D3140AE
MRRQWFGMARTVAIAMSVSVFIAGCSAPNAEVGASQGDSAAETSQVQQPATQSILIDGSSTVHPLTDEAVKEFEFEREDEPRFAIAFSGTTAGFRKFCAGETDITNASRPITSAEIAACKAAGVQYIELPVAFDALTVVVHPSNTWANDLTVEELKRLWEPAADGQMTTWNQIRAEWPNQPIQLYGAGQDSGTFDYFTEAIVGESGASRRDYTASEDDAVLVQGVANDPNGLGYFGYAYYEEAQTKLKPVAIADGEEAVLPSDQAVVNNQYHPLARPLFIYVSVRSLQEKPVLREFVEYYLTHASNLANTVGYVPLSDETYQVVQDHLINTKVGTAFGGKAQTDLTLDELLQREKAF